jgi:signal transduction histidine kinase
MRASAETHRTPIWRASSVYGGDENGPMTGLLGRPSGVLGYVHRSRPRLMFLAWYVGSFLTWNWAVVELRMHRLADLPFPEFGLLLWWVVMVAFALPVALLWERRVEERHRREIAELQQHRQEANLKLLVLQAQIEPHFLFNTFASLRALLREDVTQAEAMVDALVRHLRAILPVMRADPGISTLSDQLAICTSYLELMAIRLEDRLTYRVDVPSALLHLPFPPMVLLTLVENAVKHGIEPKASTGRIRIEAERITTAAAFALAVRVVDDGVGLSTGLGHGLGLQNVREQLALRYGEHAALSLTGPPEGGAVASISISLYGDNMI